MVDLATLQAVSYIMGSLGVSVAAIYYVYSMRISQKNQEFTLKAQEQTLETRQAQLFMQLYTIFTNYEFKTKWNDMMNVWDWKDFEDFNSKYGWATNPAEFSKFDFIGTFFEGIGVLVKRGLVDVTLVDDLMSGHIVSGWEKFGPLVKDFRIALNWPQCLEWWEYLYHEVKSIMEKQHPELIKKEMGTRASVPRQ